MAGKERTKRQSSRFPDLPLGRQPLNSLLQCDLLFQFLHPRFPRRKCILPPPLLDFLLIVMRNPRSLFVKFVLLAFLRGNRVGTPLLLASEEGWHVFARCGRGVDVFAGLSGSVERE